jgi:hypothetical protein
MSLIYQLRILRLECVREDVYLFNDSEQAHAAGVFAKAHIQTQHVDLSVLGSGDGRTDTTTLSAFKKDICMLEGLELEDLEEGEAPPNFNDPETFIDAATQHAEDDDPDHEVGDLQEYFRAAFELLSPEQKAAFLKDDRVQSCLVAAGVIEEQD